MKCKILITWGIIFKQKVALASTTVKVHSLETSEELVPDDSCFETKEAFLTKKKFGVHPYSIWKSSGYCDIQIWLERLWKVSWLKRGNILKIMFTKVQVKRLNFNFSWWRQWEHTLDDFFCLTERDSDTGRVWPEQLFFLGINTTIPFYSTVLVLGKNQNCQIWFRFEKKQNCLFKPEFARILNNT